MNATAAGLPAEIKGRIQLWAPKRRYRFGHARFDTAELFLAGRIRVEADTLVLMPRPRRLALLLVALLVPCLVATIGVVASSEPLPDALRSLPAELAKPEFGLPMLIGAALAPVLFGVAWWRCRQMQLRFPFSQVVNVKATERWVEFVILPGPEEASGYPPAAQEPNSSMSDHRKCVFMRFRAAAADEALGLKQILPETCAPVFDPKAEEADFDSTLENASAYFHLGMLYEQRGKETEAARWYRLAAERGYANAQVNLGIMYCAGTGVTEDTAEAVRWWRLAAEQGNVAAQLNLGQVYGYGKGVAKDTVEAYKWLTLAQASDAQAAKKRKELLSVMAPDQITEARKRAKEFVAQPKDKVAAEKAEFTRKLALATPTTWATWVLLTLNVLAFAAVRLSGTPPDDLGFRWGTYGPLTVSGQWWRLFANCFLNVNVVSLVIVSLALLWSRRIERLFGAPLYLAIYLASGLTAALVWICWQPLSVSVAPLSAIFGVWGALLGYLVRWHKAVSGSYKRKVLGTAGVIALYFVVYRLEDFPTKLLADSGLVAGFLFGVLFGAAAARPLEPDRRRAATTRAALWFACSVVLAGSMLLRHVFASRLPAQEALAKKAVQTMKRAESGEARSKYELGLMHLGGEGLPKDGVRAFNCLLTAANGGYAPAQDFVGTIYAKAGGLLIDTPQPFDWLSLHGPGHLLESNPAKSAFLAFDWFSKAANQGLAEAQYHLALTYEGGRPRPRNPMEAASWFRLAAEQGLAEAQYKLGWMYYSGTDLTRDYGEAARWFKKAAEAGHSNAQALLGGFLQFNDEPVEVYKWLALAAAGTNIFDAICLSI
jgi:TPR repeat protein